MFKWENFSKSLLQELARGAGLRVTFAAEDLDLRFGTPPSQTLVDDLWNVLRDRWLGSSPQYRSIVVDRLRAMSLGNGSIRVSNKTGQMQFLKSCRISSGLRTIVHEEFLAAGAATRADDASVESAPRNSDPSLETVEFVLANLDDLGCARLELVLISAIGDAILKFPIPQRTDATMAAAHFASNIEIAIITSFGRDDQLVLNDSVARPLICRGAREIAANHRVPELRATLVQLGIQMFSDSVRPVEQIITSALPTVLAIIASGDFNVEGTNWSAMHEEAAWAYERVTELMEPAEEPADPTDRTPSTLAADDKESGQRDNVDRDGDPGDEDKRSGILSRIISRIRGSEDSNDAALPPLAPATTTIAPDEAASPDAGAARERILELLGELFGQRPTLDSDGDVPIPVGSTVLFLRTIESGTPFLFVQVEACLVRGVSLTPTLEHAMLEAQDQIPFLGRLSFARDSVFLRMEIPADQITLAELDFLINNAASAADYFDSILATAFGGSTVLKDRGDVIEA